MTTEAPYEMANLFPKHTGLPFVVWISVRGGARHDVRVKVSSNNKAMPGDMASVAIRPDVAIVEGLMPGDDFQLLKRWIDLNRQTLVDYWNSEIDTQDAIAALVKI